MQLKKSWVWNDSQQTFHCALLCGCVCGCVRERERVFITFYLFIFGWAGSLLLRDLFSGWGSLRCSGFSSLWLPLLWSAPVGLAAWTCVASTRAACELSTCGFRGLEHRLGSCGPRAWLLCGTWDLPRPEMEPASLVLADGVLTTESPGKPRDRHLLVKSQKSMLNTLARGAWAFLGRHFQL